MSQLKALLKKKVFLRRLTFVCPSTVSSNNTFSILYFNGEPFRCSSKDWMTATSTARTVVGLTTIAQLQRVQNVAPRLTKDLRPRSARRDLHWLPIRHLITYRVALNKISHQTIGTTELMLVPTTDTPTDTIKDRINVCRVHYTV